MPDQSAITGLLHAGLLISDLATARTFYESVLGFTPLDRPDLPYPGAWYALNQQQQLHLMQLPNPDQASIRPPHGGRDRHIAFGIADMDSLRVRLDAMSIVYTMSKSGRRAMFCRDPDGNTLEFIEIKSVSN
ncbi:MAG: VOC family protein [Thiobacillus sp.]